MPPLNDRDVKLRATLRWALRVFILTLAAVMAWSTRFTLDPDGMSYIDVARCYLRGDWTNALSTYWSPLYPWLLTLVFGVGKPGPEWVIPLTHAVCWFEFLGMVLAWEWLQREWEAWKGAPREWALIDAAGYLLIGWTGLDLAGVDFNSADDAVIFFLLLTAALLTRIWREADTRRDWITLGIVLAFGFYAKAAFSTVIPVILILLFWKRKPAALTAAAALCLTLLPFVIPASLTKGRFALSDTGKMNYAWQVSGYGVEGYKEEGFPAPANIPHPIPHLLESPRVISFTDHMVGTTPVHFDPLWWCAGYPANINWERQWMVLRANIPETLSEFRWCPALWLTALLLPFGLRRFQLGSAWFLWLPALAMSGSYCFVYVLSRYTAGPFMLFGFGLLAACWNIELPRWTRLAGIAVLLASAWFSLSTEWDEGVMAAWKEFRGLERADDAYMVDVCLYMQHQGFQPGDRIGLIGMTLGVQYLQLLEGQESAAVPARLYHIDNEWGRPLRFTWEKIDEFWAADESTKRRVYNAMRSTGAKWVFASQVPKWADTTGWTPIIEEKILREEPVKQILYYRRL